MPFLTDIAPGDRIELKKDDSTITLKAIKRTGSKVRLSIEAGREVLIHKIDAGSGSEKSLELGNKD